MTGGRKARILSVLLKAGNIFGDVDKCYWVSLLSFHTCDLLFFLRDIVLFIVLFLIVLECYSKFILKFWITDIRFYWFIGPNIFPPVSGRKLSVFLSHKSFQTVTSGPWNLLVPFQYSIYFLPSTLSFVFTFNQKGLFLLLLLLGFGFCVLFGFKDANGINYWSQATMLVL